MTERALLCKKASLAMTLVSTVFQQLSRYQLVTLTKSASIYMAFSSRITGARSNGHSIGGIRLGLKTRFHSCNITTAGIASISNLSMQTEAHSLRRLTSVETTRSSRQVDIYPHFISLKDELDPFNSICRTHPKSKTRVQL